MAVLLEQRRRHVDVPLGGVGVHHGRRTADDGLHHLGASLPEPDLSSIGLHLRPGRPAVDIEIGPEPERVERTADAVFQLAQALQVDDRDIAGGVVGEAMAHGVHHLQRPGSALAQQPAQPGCEGFAPLGLVEAAVEGLQSRGLDMQHGGVFVVGRAGLGHLGDLGEDREPVLGDEGGSRRIEARGTVLDRIDPVAGEEAADLEADAGQALGREAFHRMAIEGDDAAGHAA